MTREEKIAELTTYLPEQVLPPSRAEIAAWQETESYAEARRTNKVREVMNGLCTREPTQVVVGEPDTSGWDTFMLKLYKTCKNKGTPFVLKTGRTRIMYVVDESALDQSLASARKFPRTFKRTFGGES